MVPFSRGAAEVAAGRKLPLSQNAFFLYSANHFWFLHMTKRFLSNQITKRAGFLLPVVQTLHYISYQLQKVREIVIALLTSGLADL